MKAFSDIRSKWWSRVWLPSALLIAFATGTAAQEEKATFPARQVRIVAPFPPGGPVDALARVIAEGVAAIWKQAVIVENRVGASGVR